MPWAAAEPGLLHWPAEARAADDPVCASATEPMPASSGLEHAEDGHGDQCGGPLTDCDRHRPYLAAIADGKASLVSVATFEHIVGCPRCRAQLEFHMLLADRPPQTTLPPAPAPADRPFKVRRPRPVAALAMVGATALLVAGLAAGTVVWNSFTGQDAVAAAVSAASQPPQFRSGDPVQIDAWCTRETGHAMPDIPLPALHPLGARVDRKGGHLIVTVSYRTETGQPVKVSWLDDQVAPRRAYIESRSIDGQRALVVPGSMGSAVVTGLAPASVLMSVATTIESEEDRASQPP